MSDPKSRMEEFVDAIHLRLDDKLSDNYPNGIDKDFGPLPNEFQEAPPRVMWEPGPFTKTVNKGAGTATSPATGARMQGFNVFVLGEHYQETELILDELLNQIEKAAGSSARVSGGDWAGESEYWHDGVVATFQVTLDQAVCDPPARTFKLVGAGSVGHTSGIAGTSTVECES